MVEPENTSTNLTMDPPSSPPRGGPEAPRPLLDRQYFVRLTVRAVTFLLVGILLIILLGVSQRFGWISAGGGTAVDDGSGAAGAIYTCPMHPNIRQPNPGRCPICAMPLEPATADGGGPRDEYAVTIEQASRRLANIQTAPVQQRTVAKRLESVGRIAIDESRQSTIAAYVSGRIERLFADYTGVEVTEGDHLAVIYSPQLYATQVEFTESKRALETLQGATLASVRRTQERLFDGARQRLVELGMTAEQIAELEQTGEERSRITVYSPIGGTVIEKLLVEGQYVEAGEPIYQIADLSTVWLLLQLFPEDATLIRFGQRVEVEVQSLPGTSVEGRVAFVSPVVDTRTRTVDVRVELLNPEGLLRPGDYARAEVLVPLGAQDQVYDADLAGKWISPMHPQIIRDQPGTCPICGMDLVSTQRYGYAADPVPQPEVLVVPRRAVLMTGSTSLVYVETEVGRFEIRPVKLGPLLRDEAVILSGVTAGEQVAVSGNFLIDSQMQLAAKPSLIDPQRAIARKPEKEAPLQLPDSGPQAVAGQTGEELERLYQAYAALVATFAADELPTEVQVDAVQSLSRSLATAEPLTEPQRELASQTATDLGHLHHRPIGEAREQFKSVSRHVLLLASEVRGEDATNELVHFFCDMVPSGNANWLQLDKPIANPYMGSKMLRCATFESVIGVPATPTREEPTMP